MFIVKHKLNQAIMDEGADGGGLPDTSTDNVLDDSASNESTAPDMNIEQFLASFDGDEKEKAHRYASKFANEKGNLDVTNMIKSGYSLESKFGAFTGSPDSYEIKTPEFMDGDVNMDDPYLQEFQTLAKEANMNQASFEKFMDIHLRASIAPPVDVDEMSKEIGPEFNAMRSNMAGFFKSRLDADTFKALNGMITGVDSFKALYSVFKASKPTKMDDTVRDSFNQSEMKDQMEAEYHAKNEHGTPKMQDPIYAKSWRTRWEPFISQSDM